MLCSAAPQGSPQHVASAAAAATLSLLLFAPLPAGALNAAKVGACLLENCQLALASCLADEKCVESLVCLNRCNGLPNEAACQIGCGDEYASPAIKAFNACAVTNKKCVPQRVDKGLYPLPPPEALVSELDVADLEGRWFITAGLNKLCVPRPRRGAGGSQASR